MNKWLGMRRRVKVRARMKENNEGVKKIVNRRRRVWEITEGREERRNDDKTKEERVNTCKTGGRRKT